MILDKFKKDVDYYSYPKTLDTYKWYKPILVALLTGVFYAIFAVIVMIVWVVLLIARGESITDSIAVLKNGYDSFNTYSMTGAFITLGMVVIFIPALAIAARIVKDRPFSSYSSSMGGWRMNVFIKCLGLAFLISSIPVTIISYIEGGIGQVRFEVAGFIICTLLGPLQCIAEEYIFRGLITQTARSWLRSTVLAMIISALLFMSQHPYNIFGMVEIFLTGFAMCVMAYLGNGIEASSAIHVANNMALFYLTGFGVGRISSQTGILDVVETVVIDCVYIVVLIYIQDKYHWFDEKKLNKKAKVFKKGGYTMCHPFLWWSLRWRKVNGYHEDNCKQLRGI